eukprot:763929-Hanusia_phi.AAC.2
MSSIGFLNREDSVKEIEADSDAPTVMQFLHVPGDTMVPSACKSPASPAATTTRKSGWSHTNLSMSAACVE